MMRAFSRVVSLILAMTMMIGMTGITVVFAATNLNTNTFDINEGDITIKDSGNGFEVAYGTDQKKFVTFDKEITLTGGSASTASTKKIVITRSTANPLKLIFKDLYVTSTAQNSPAIAITGTAAMAISPAPTSIKLSGNSILTGHGTAAGISTPGAVTIDKSSLATDALTVKGGATGISINAKTVSIPSGIVNADNGITATGTAVADNVSIGSAATVTTLSKGIKGRSILLAGNVSVTAPANQIVLDGATTQSGGKLTVGGGTVINLTANGGTTHLNAGKVSTLTIGGGNVTMNGASEVTTANLNAGTLKVTSAANLKSLIRTNVTANTYIDNHYTSADTSLVDKTFSGMGTASGAASLSATGYVTRSYKVTNGSFKACVPNTAIDFTVSLNGKTYTGKGSTNAAAAITLKEVVAPPQPTTPTVTMATPTTSKYKQDIVINYTCSKNTTASAFANAIGSVKLGSTALTLNAKNGYTVVPKDATTGVITIKGAANKAVANNVAITVAPKVANSYAVTNPSPINIGKNTGTLQVMSIEAPLGTSSTKLKNDYVPTGVTIKLDGTTETENFPVTWVLSGYRENTRTKQTFSSTKIVKNPMENLVTLSPADKKATLEVTLYREEVSSSSRYDNDNDNGTYDDVQGFWSDVKDEIEFAEKGDEINVELGPLDKMPTSVLDKLKGKDVTLVLERSTGSDIVISGKKVKAPPSNLIYYSVSELASMYKGGSTGTSNSSSSSTANGGGTTTTPKPSSSTTAPKPSSSTAATPSSSKPAAVTSSESSSSESSEVSETTSEEEPESSESSEEEDIPADKPEEETKEKKKISPVMAVVIVTAGVAVLAGAAALIVLRNR